MSALRTLPVRAVDDSEDYDPLDSCLPGRRQLASWITSMVFHLALLLVLALLVLGGKIEEPFKDLTIRPTESPTDVKLEVPPVEQLKVTPDEPTGEPDELVPLTFDMPDEAPPNIPEPTITPEPIDVDNFVVTESFASTTSDDLTATLPKVGKDRFFKRGIRDIGPPGTGRATPDSEFAVKAALKWLATHQNRNGSWSFDHTVGDRCSGFANPGDKRSRLGATGLALLCFLGAGYTHDEGEYKKTVERGIRYLVKHMHIENNTGRLFEAGGANHEHMYCHGIAACALAEAYGMTQAPRLRVAAQFALNYIVAAQDPIGGGWLYTPRAGGDTSVAGWQIMALKSGVLSYLNVPATVKPLANRWLDSVQSDVPPGDYGIGSRYGYRVAKDRHGQSGACTAIGLLCRNYLGTPKDDVGLRAGVRWVFEQGPHANDMYFNYYASMVMFQNDGTKGEMWVDWFKKISDQLEAAQVREGRDRGSWHFTGNHGNSGGRLYNTALACLTLEVPYRYMPVYQRENVERDDFPLE